MNVEATPILFGTLAQLPLNSISVAEVRNAGRQRRSNALASNGWVQQPAGEKGSIAHEFCRKTESLLPRQQFVLWVARFQLLTSIGRLPIGGRHHYQLVHSLHVPARVHERRGQPVQQHGMSRQIATRAEVFRGCHQPLTEELVPHPVDRDSCRQRIVPADHPACQAQSGRFWSLRQRRENGRSSRLNLNPRLPKVAADQNVGFGRVGIFDKRLSFSQPGIVFIELRQFFHEIAELEFFVLFLLQNDSVVLHKVIGEFVVFLLAALLRVVF